MAEAIKSIREAAGISLRETANALGMDNSTISLWENSRRSPMDERQFAELARFYISEAAKRAEKARKIARTKGLI